MTPGEMRRRLPQGGDALRQTRRESPLATDMKGVLLHTAPSASFSGSGPQIPGEEPVEVIVPRTGGGL